MTASPGSFSGEGNWFDRPEVPAERELAFEPAEERLPWLESEEDGDEPPAYDTGRIVGLGLIMLVALVVLVGGVWFVANRGIGGEPAPDGSLIEAPPVPYKERPVSPGGKTFAGTGDTSYAVGAGKEVEARLATGSPPSASPSAALPTAMPRASAKPALTPAPKPGPEGAEAPLPAGTAVQVGAYSTRADAEAGWRRLIGQTDALSGVSHHIIAGRADIGTVYRLQAAGGDKAGAQSLCGRLKAVGIACQVK